MTLQLFLTKPDRNPLQCSICYERFSEEWMAKRCSAQGPPHIEYHIQDVAVNKAGHLIVCSAYYIHHGIGVKCHAEGPCPHDITYYGYELVPTLFGGERAWISSVGLYRTLRPGWEKLTTLTQKWGVVPESGNPKLYLAVDPQAEWEKLWSYYPERRGRRGGRRLIPANE